MSYPVEDIPDEDLLYKRIHIRNDFRDGKVIPGAFRERVEGTDKGMSTDWSKYSTPKKTKNRARKPKENAVISFITLNLISLKLNVIHHPEPLNRAHTNITGIGRDPEIRTKLKDSFVWEIRFENFPSLS